ncbi:MAG TPA: hypothetical protein VND66_14080 [Acidobacteriaceae bacterium]|nr:hypothetical protein [Terriglobia bacterium]HVC91740.1 hypothetical protein [Acidobacteriaceae bacterium]
MFWRLPQEDFINLRGKTGTKPISAEKWIGIRRVDVLYRESGSRHRAASENFDARIFALVEYGFVRGGIRYDFTAFAATLDGTPSGPLVDFIRVRVENENKVPTTAWISTGMRYEGLINSTGGIPDNRYKRPATGDRAVEQYKAEYAARYQKFLQPGQQ